MKRLTPRSRDSRCCAGEAALEALEAAAGAVLELVEVDDGEVGHGDQARENEDERRSGSELSVVPYAAAGMASESLFQVPA